MTGVAGPVKGVAGGGASPDGLSSCHIGGVNLPAEAPVPVQNIFVIFFTFLLSKLVLFLDTLCPHIYYTYWQLGVDVSWCEDEVQQLQRGESDTDLVHC